MNTCFVGTAHHYMLDNCDIAILAKVNQLLELHGIPACDVVVTAGTRSDGHYAVIFETGTFEPQAQAAFDRLMKGLGIPDDVDQLTGSERDIYRRLSTYAKACQPSHQRHQR